MAAPLQLEARRGVDADVLTDDDLVACVDGSWASIGRAHLELLTLIREVGRREAWRVEPAQTLPHWVQMRYGVSAWKAERWVAAADALEHLPRIASALASGTLGIDQVVELTRFATPETETALIGWAEVRSSGAIRRRADLERRRERAEVVAAERDRSLRTWYSDEGTRFGLEAMLPADQGAVVERALERLADRVPADPEEADHPYPREVRQADALVLLCSGSLAADPDHDRATVVVHARLETLIGENVTPKGGALNAEAQAGPVLAPETARRLACDGRIQVLVEDAHGSPLRLGRMTRTPSASMLRLLRHRDRSCRFPGCGRRRYTDAHHVVWWSRGGRTDLDNLVLLCGFHHRLVHERGWRLQLDPDASVGWFRPNGERYRSGPAPPG